VSLEDDIDRRRARVRYPRRSEATFTDENDHNPQVLQDCAGCRGSGTQCHHIIDDGGEQYALDRCTDCGGTGVTGATEPYFPDETSALPASADDKGWITCPRCDWRFALRDRHAWTGRRHLQCGQKIRISES